MKLNLLNRFQILQILNAAPERGTFVDMSIKYSLLKKLSFSGKEIDKYEIKEVEIPDPKNPEMKTQATQWNKKGMEMVNYDIADSEIRYLSRIIDGFDNIGPEDFDTCYKIKEAEKAMLKVSSNDSGDTE